MDLTTQTSQTFTEIINFTIIYWSIFLSILWIISIKKQMEENKDG
jgi:large-conductance mechanosensitive channel